MEEMLKTYGHSGVEESKKGKGEREMKTAEGGMSFTGVLALIFIVLKLCGVIAWSWWWVLSPLWIPAATVVVVLSLVFMAAVILRGRKKGT